MHRQCVETCTAREITCGIVVLTDEGELRGRCHDVPILHRHKRRFCWILGIIPGPVEPKVWEHYISLIGEDFKRIREAGTLAFPAV